MKFQFLLLSAIIVTPASAFSQQVNSYTICTTYTENYTPGYYDSNGNYIQGSVNVQRYSSPCSNGNSPTVVVQPRPQYYYRPRVCNPGAGALLGAGIASAITGNKYNYGGSYYRNYNRGSYNGGWNRYGSNSYGWSALGAGLGALAFSC